jgi:ArsR family transcriptional regulator
MVLNIIQELNNKVQMYDLQSQVFKLLSHPARIAILEILRDEENCVCHIETILGFRQAYISQQLSVLREAGLIQDRRDGWNIFYRVVRPEVYNILDAAYTMAASNSPLGSQRLDNAQCPCPKCAARRGLVRVR